MSKRQKRQIIDFPVYLSKLHSTWLIVIFYPKSNERAVCSEEKPQLERRLAHAQTFDRGVARRTKTSGAEEMRGGGDTLLQLKSVSSGKL